MKIFLVGGAVRDKLLGLPVKERDWVVVGATVEEMLALGYKQVGKDFPVFLHPQTREEYALARVERKISPGYLGFKFDTSTHVTLEEDLARRDLTINAMAETPEGKLIDPFHGAQDIAHKVLRHVSPAFAEDPVRILRIGRFLARYYHLGFHVADETLTLMQEMVASGEVDALVAERVWKEWERALAEKNPVCFFKILESANALKKLFPMIEMQSKGMHALSTAAELSSLAIVRFAALLHDLSAENIKMLCNNYRIPNHYRQLALLTANYHKTALQTRTLSATQLLSLFNALDIYRRELRFTHFLLACKAIAVINNESFDADWLLTGARIVKSVPVHDLIAQGLEGAMLAQALQKKRHEKIAQWLQLS